MTSSAGAPALPYITRRRVGPDELARLRAGLARAAADPALSEVREQLLLEGFVVRPLSVYDRILEMEAEAAAYPNLP